MLHVDDTRLVLGHGDKRDTHDGLDDAVVMLPTLLVEELQPALNRGIRFQGQVDLLVRREREREKESRREERRAMVKMEWGKA
jgi:hypothetical protein